MKFSEKVLSRVHEIMDHDKCDMIEALGVFCQENDMDPDDLVHSLDKSAIKQLKYDAIKNRRVRQCVATLGPEIM
jgi:hypothetical protein